MSTDLTINPDRFAQITQLKAGAHSGRVVNGRAIAVGDRVRDLFGRTAGVVLQVSLGGTVARVAFEGQRPREVPVSALERVR